MPGPISPAQIDRVLEETFGRRLRRHGFQRVDGRRWVRSARAPIREVFLFWRAKGAALVPAYGFSLDFVPGVSRSSVRWHRSPRAARLDVRHEPHWEPEADTAPANYLVELFSTTDEASASAEAMAAALVPKSTRYFHAVRSEADLPSLIRREIKLRQVENDPLWMPHYLALPFSLARLGRLKQAHTALDEYFVIEPEARLAEEKLTRLLVAAAAERAATDARSANENRPAIE